MARWPADLMVACSSVEQAASELPVTFPPPGTGDYKGGGFVLGLKPELDGRLCCVRLQPGAETHAFDLCQIGGKTVVVCSETSSAKMSRASCVAQRWADF